ncbi:hypothetical protein K1T71_013397 [Dendrolimus kikuchii]|uniref:Uncharacterized protein n=1 Tax=Dendrolimus kikuchii TaxID=765133 RepID=A0ACC1CHX9_9NEOP|nr:hypothetical protein K1T71_013397 [Dendrolimus kikuchii]
MVREWITPWKKQCFVVTGVSINISQLGMVMGFAAVLLPQLRLKNSSIPVDEDSASWIAALPGIALLFGNFSIPPIMAKFGRKKANFLSIGICLIGWLGVATSKTLTWLIIARFLQGFGMGMGSCIAPVLIGEYSSPTNRGPFSMMMSLIMAVGTLTIHAVGSYCTWQTTAIVGTCITFADMLIVIFSPESPSWLAARGRFEDCRRSFRWLRGYTDEEELATMLTANKACQENKQNASSFNQRLTNFGEIVRKREFYKPVLIMIHIYTMGQWAGINILAPFAIDIVNELVGASKYVPYIVIGMDIERLLSGVLAVYIIRKLNRRTMLFTTLGLNTLIIFLTAGYSYIKTSGYYSHPAIGVTLIMLHMFTIATGSLPLPYTIAGEIFPLEYRSLSSGISALFSSLNIFLSVKTLPFLFDHLGVHGAYGLYGCILLYCLTVAWFFLPETKDRTLQDIEDDIRGIRREKSNRPLTALIRDKNEKV